MVVDLIGADVERHAPEQLLARFVSESKRLGRIEKHVVRIERARSARRQMLLEKRIDLLYEEYLDLTDAMREIRIYAAKEQH